MLRSFKTALQALARIRILGLRAAPLAVLLATSAPCISHATGTLSIGKSADAATFVQTQQVHAELVAHAPDGVGVGKTVWVGLQIAHQPQWHTYWQNPGDSGLPTRLDWELPAGVTASDIAWPTPQKITIGTLANFGFEGTVLLPVQLTISNAFKAPVSGSLPVKLHASWLVCKQECVPQDGTFTLQVPLTGSTALHAADFAAVWDAAPKALQGKSSVALDGDALVLRVTGLPPAWRGKSLFAVPETQEIIEGSTAPDEHDAAANGSVPKPHTQSWTQDANPAWSARIPLSSLRSTAPKSLVFVLALGKQSVRTVAPVEGKWPAIAEAGLPPAPAGGQAGTAPQLKPLNTTADAGGAPASWLLALFSAVLGGLILNLMPCVFPVLAIKVLAFASARDKSGASHRAQGFAYTAGVVLSFMALGGLMLGLRSAGEQLGWGFQLQSPTVIATLTLLFTLIALNLMGLLNFGQLLPSGLASLQLRHPVADAFLSGVLAVAIASPCTAPFMGASLGYAIALPASQALAIFAALGTGLALPYLAASCFTGVNQWLPRPGAWMETLRRFMAFPMWATVIWLLWVLGHLSGVDGAASLSAILLAVALLAWSASQPGHSKSILMAIAVAILVALIWATGANVLKVEDAQNAPAANGEGTNAVGWQAWAPGRVDSELAAGKPVFVDFTAAWCITCQYNKKTTLSNTQVITDFAAKKVQLLRADWTRRDPAITQALTDLGRSGVPVYVLYQPGQAPVVFSEILSQSDLRAALGKLL
jgi:thiol:disulfide interchange protein DsbD